MVNLPKTWAHLGTFPNTWTLYPTPGHQCQRVDTLLKIWSPSLIIRFHPQNRRKHPTGGYPRHALAPSPRAGHSSQHLATLRTHVGHTPKHMVTLSNTWAPSPKPGHPPHHLGTIHPHCAVRARIRE